MSTKSSYNLDSMFLFIKSLNTKKKKETKVQAYISSDHLLFFFIFINVFLKIDS